MTTTRFDFAKRNAGYGLLSTLVTVLLGFVARTVFIANLGAAYLGVNTLMLNVLGVLSFVELGIGSAMNYSLYKPMAENDLPTIRALTRFYKRVYRIIALIVTLLGLALLPFVPHLASGSEGLGDLRVYYLLFLAANVMSYFAVYKTTLANADQRAYLVTNVRTGATIALQTAQIATLLMWQNYLAFLIVMVAMKAAEQIALNLYLSKRYRSLLGHSGNDELTPAQLDPIKKNVKALVWHKLGEVAVNQTDSIIIAAFINVTTLGLLSNYNLVINTATLFLSIVINAAIGGFGNAIATETPQGVYRLYKTYRFAAFWLYGLATVGMAALLTPLIGLWLGDAMLLNVEIVFLTLINFYLLGQRTTINTIKSAAGIWNADKYLPLIQAVTNLALSVWLVQVVGLAGVLLGTLVQGLIATIVRPIIVYRRVFGANPGEYFTDGSRFLAVVAFASATAYWAVQVALPTVTVVGFLLAVVVVALWANLVFLAAFGRTAEFRGLVARVFRRTKPES